MSPILDCGHRANPSGMKGTDKCFSTGADLVQGNHEYRDLIHYRDDCEFEAIIDDSCSLLKHIYSTAELAICGNATSPPPAGG